MFADDTNLTASGNTSPELYNKLNDDLGNYNLCNNNIKYTL